MSKCTRDDGDNGDGVRSDMDPRVVRTWMRHLLYGDPLLFARENVSELVSSECCEIVRRQYPPRNRPFDAQLRSICESEFEWLVAGDGGAFDMPPRYVEHRPPTVLRKRRGVARHLEMLRRVKQPEQRTAEWYDLRNNLVTASNAWMALGTEASVFSLLKEKVVLKTLQSDANANGSQVLLESTPFEWGKKYEPVSTRYYEMEYDTDVIEYGCIVHRDYSFLGASPDGINGRRGSKLQGRMLEVKNPVSRVITGVPKKEYWVQMQLQMEVCDLDECDFLETKFVEYTEYEEYAAIRAQSGGGGGAMRFGTILVFIKDEALHYVYSPPEECATLEEECAWSRSFREKAEKERTMTWYKTLHWQLVEVSCVLVQRNRRWFESAAPVLSAFWERVLRYRRNPSEWEEYKGLRAKNARPRAATAAAATAEAAGSHKSHRHRGALPHRCLITVRGVPPKTPPSASDDKPPPSS